MLFILSSTMGLLHFIVKYTLYLYNLIFTILGIALIVIGVLIHLELVNLQFDAVVNDEEDETVIEILATSIIVFGCMTFFMAFIGCCGAVTETKCLLVTHAVTMFVLLTLKIYQTVAWKKEINSLRDSVKESINYTFDVPAHNVTMHSMEASFQCCGTTGPDSYKVLPPSCCALESNESNNADNACLLEKAFKIGCLELVDGFIVDTAPILKIVLIVTIVFEMLEFIAAVYLCIYLLQ